jgi:acyl transferase domain-containing protein
MYRYTTGALSLESACKVAYFRGKLAETVRVKNANSPGAMISINLAEDQVSAYLQNIDNPGLSAVICIACVNSPFNCTLSGQEWAINVVKAQADTDGIFAQKLATGVAYHSPYLRFISDEYVLLMGGLRRGQDGDTPVSMVSSVTGQPISPSTLLSAQYWADNMLSPVQFFKAVQYLGDQRQQAVDTLTDILEIGPHPALRRPIQDTLSFLESNIRYQYTLHRSGSPTVRILDLAGRLFCLGYPVCISTVNQQHSPLPFLVNCPPYPFDRSPFWSESRLSRDYRLRGKVSRDTLGARVADWNPLEPRWRNFLSVQSHSWIGDHKVYPFT